MDAEAAALQLQVAQLRAAISDEVGRLALSQVCASPLSFGQRCHCNSITILLGLSLGDQSWQNKW